MAGDGERTGAMFEGIEAVEGPGAKAEPQANARPGKGGSVWLEPALC